MKKRAIALLLAVAVSVGAIVYVQHREGILPTAAWGLSFGKAHSPPRGPATTAELALFDAAYVGSPEQRVIYLTFDAGYENGCTEKILDILQKHGVKASFFLVGSYMQRNADLVRRMVAQGHLVGNHTMHHPDMSKLESQQAFGQELQQAEQLFTQLTGKAMPKFYRPPQGIYSQKNLQFAKNMGYKTVFWSLAYVDWLADAQPEPRASAEKLLSRTHNGAVVLLHSTSTTNAAILDGLLTRWTDMGYRFDTVDGLFRQGAPLTAG